MCSWLLRQVIVGVGASGSSKTRNELLARTLFRSKDIESYGTGIPRIKELCDGAGVAIEYLRTPMGARLVFHRSDAFASESSTKAGSGRKWPEVARSPGPR